MSTGPTAKTMSNLDYKPFYRQHLPHYQPSGTTPFVTFRLANSLPVAVLRELDELRREAEQRLQRIDDPEKRARQASLEDRILFGRWDTTLHSQSVGPFWFGDPRVADMVADSLHFRDGKVYTLDAFSIMSNHAHIVITPLAKSDGTFHALPAIMHSLKRHTAYQANLLLGREGEFWQGGSYDHVVRDEAEYRRIVTYVLNNPVKAGLVEAWEQWRWNFRR